MKWIFEKANRFWLLEAQPLAPRWDKTPPHRGGKERGLLPPRGKAEGQEVLYIEMGIELQPPCKKNKRRETCILPDLFSRMYAATAME